jgi:hypothetical protein
MTPETPNPGSGAGARECAIAGQAGNSKHTPNPIVAQPSAAPAVITIIAQNLHDPARGIAADAWRACTEAGEVLVARTRSPLFDGARALLACGQDPDARVTMRIAGKPHDSFVPIGLGMAAGLAVEEGDRSARLRRWSGPAKRLRTLGAEAEIVPASGSGAPTPTPAAEAAPLSMPEVGLGDAGGAR